MSILTFPQKSWEVWADVILRIHLPHSVCAKVESGILACPAEMFFQPFLLENKCWSGNVKISPYWTIVEFEHPYSLKISWCQFNLHISYLSPWKFKYVFQLVAIPMDKKSSATMLSFCLYMDEVFSESEATFHYLQRKHHISYTSATLK